MYAYTLKVSAAMPAADGGRKRDRLFGFATSALFKAEGSGASSPETPDDQLSMAVGALDDACSVRPCVCVRVRSRSVPHSQCAQSVYTSDQ